MEILLKDWQVGRALPRDQKGRSTLLHLCANLEDCDWNRLPYDPSVGGSSTPREDEPGGARYEMAVMLLEADPMSVNAADGKGWTPLMTAAEWGSLPFTTLLLEHGADVTARDKDGLTALHWAAQASDYPTAPDIVKVLLEVEECDPLARANAGKGGRGENEGPTPEELATRYGTPATVAALRKLPYEGLERTEAEIREREKERRAAEKAAEKEATAAEKLELKKVSGEARERLIAEQKARREAEKEAAAAARAKEAAAAAKAAERAAAAREERRLKQLEEAKGAAMELAQCGLCERGSWRDGDPIVYCDGTRGDGMPCGVAVHQSCLASRMRSLTTRTPSSIAMSARRSKRSRRSRPGRMSACYAERRHKPIGQTATLVHLTMERGRWRRRWTAKVGTGWSM